MPGRLTVKIRAKFEAAHRLPNVPPEHKCSRMHGHSFRVVVSVAVTGQVSGDSGWVMDFADIKRPVKALLAELDHRCLNEIDGLQNPTSENIAKWIWDCLRPRLPLLSSVSVSETEDTEAVYEEA